MRLISADLDRSRAEVVISIDIENPVPEGSEPEAPLVLTYGTDRRRDGETAQHYRTRLKAWLAQTRREARLIADTKVAAAPTRDDVKADVEPAFA